MFACCPRQIHVSFGVTIDHYLLYMFLSIHSFPYLLIWVAVAYLNLAPKLLQNITVRFLVSWSKCCSLLLLIHASYGVAPMELFAVGYVYFMSMLLVTMFECCRVYISCSKVAMWLLISALHCILFRVYVLNRCSVLSVPYMKLVWFCM